MSAHSIRPAQPADIGAMQEIERAAGRLFAEIGMHDVADDEPFSDEVMARYIADGRAWIAEYEGRTAGYALADVVDGQGHLEQLSVRPDDGRRGLGRALVRTVISWAGSRGFSALTLRTFTAVPWNAPYYAALGFTIVPDDDLGAEMRLLCRHEREMGLDVEARCTMRLNIQ